MSSPESDTDLVYGSDTTRSKRWASTSTSDPMAPSSPPDGYYFVDFTG